MSAVLLDTDVFSFLLKGDTRSKAYSDLIVGNTPAISFMTVAELYQWAYIRNWSLKRIAELERTMANYLVPALDGELCHIWGRLRAERQAKGMTIAAQDAWIAATALRYSLQLITHNPDDFKDIAGLQILTA